MVHLEGKLEIEVIQAHGLPNADKSKRNPSNKSDPYVIVKVSDGKKEHKIGKTPTIDDCLDPKWEHRISHDVHQDVKEIVFEVKDDDVFKDDKLGGCSIPVENILAPQGYQGMVDLHDKKRNRAGHLHVKVNYMGRFAT